MIMFSEAKTLFKMNKVIICKKFSFSQKCKKRIAFIYLFFAIKILLGGKTWMQKYTCLIEHHISLYGKTREYPYEDSFLGFILWRRLLQGKSKNIFTKQFKHMMNRNIN